jgi:hypothetical protein
VSSAHRGTGSRSEWRRVAADEHGNDPVCAYLEKGGCWGRITWHHPLGKKRDPLFTIPACEGHHGEITARDNKMAAKTNTPRKGRPPAAKAPAKADPEEIGWPRHLAAIGVVLLIPAVWQKDVTLAVRTEAAYGLLILAGLYLVATGARRREATTRVRVLAAREMKADPDLVAQHKWWQVTRRPVDAWGWTGVFKVRPMSGVITYPTSVQDHDLRVLSAVEDAFWNKLGATVEWTPLEDRLSWTRLDKGTGQVDTRRADMSAPAGDTQSIPVTASGSPLVALEETLTHDLNNSFRVSNKVLPIRARVVGSDADGPTEIVVSYPPGYVDKSDEDQLLLLNRVTAKTGQRWQTDWRTTEMTVTLTRRPFIATDIPFPFDLGCKDMYRVPFGLGESRVVEWVLKQSPHLLVAGDTGGGKTRTLTEIAYALLLRGWRLILVDGKGFSFAALRHLPGVIGVGLKDGEKMNHQLERACAEIARRNQLVMDDDREPESFERWMVMVDEGELVFDHITAWWDAARDRQKDPKTAPGLDAFSEIVRVGREVGVHLVLATQSVSAGIFGTSGVRDQMAARLAMGPLSLENARMMFGRADVGRDILAVPGRATFQPAKGMSGAEVQIFHAPRPKPSGAYPEEHEAFLTELADRIHAVQPGGRKLAAVPVGSPEPEVVDFDDIARACQRDGHVWIILDGEPVKATGVADSEEKGVVAELLFIDTKGHPRMAAFTQEESFVVAEAPEAA